MVFDYFLIFNSHFDRDSGVDIGRLSLNSLSKGTIDILKASSSYSTKQYPESFHDWGGYLPPEYRVPGLPNWLVDITPIDLSHVKGVGGNFYRIHPFEVRTDKQGKRSDFGIHLDANAPGSLGCIVLSADRFSKFESWMRNMGNLRENKQINLYVRYS